MPPSTRPSMPGVTGSAWRHFKRRFGPASPVGPGHPAVGCITPANSDAVGPTRGISRNFTTRPENAGVMHARPPERPADTPPRSCQRGRGRPPGNTRRVSMGSSPARKRGLDAKPLSRPNSRCQSEPLRAANATRVRRRAQSAPGEIGSQRFQPTRVKHSAAEAEISTAVVLSRPVEALTSLRDLAVREAVPL